MRLSAQIKLAWLLPKPLKSAEKDGERERQRKTKKRKYHQAIKLRSSTHKKRVECRRRHIQYWNTNIVRGNVQHRYLWPRLALSGIQPQGCRAGPVGRASALRSAPSAFSKMRRFLCVCVCVCTASRSGSWSACLGKKKIASHHSSQQESCHSPNVRLMSLPW